MQLGSSARLPEVHEGDRSTSASVLLHLLMFLELDKIVASVYCHVPALISTMLYQ